LPSSKTLQGPGRKLSECIAIAKAYEKNLGYAPVPDADFAADVQADMAARKVAGASDHSIIWAEFD
jgi:hypothetical protein